MSGDTIRAWAVVCQGLFAQCLSLLHTEDITWFEMRRGEFNIWAYGLQALSVGKSSLDYRVRDRGDVSEIILALLRGLSKDLEDCIKIDRRLPSQATDGITSPVPDEQCGEDFDFVDFSDDEANSEATASILEEGLFSLQMYNIRTVIAQLTRFSSMIRRSGSKFRFKQADSALAIRESEYDDFKEHLTSLVLIRSIKFYARGPKISEVLKDKMNPGLLTPVQKRLIHGNILRRNRIMESMKNARPVGYPAKGGLKEPTHDWKFVLPTMKASAPTGKPSRELAQSNTGGTVESNAQSKTESIARSATDIGSQLGLQLVPPKAAPSTTTRVTKIGIDQDYPKCPKPISDDFIQCPYCDDMLSADYNKRSSRWREHVAQDILPYMCIYEQCPLPDEMYLTSEEMVSHVREHHATTMWVCNFCRSKAGEAEIYVFETSIQWQEHMHNSHGVSIPVQQLASLARVNELQLIRPVPCPLCAYTTVGMQTTVDLHILQHLQEFALRSLPPAAVGAAESLISDSSVGVMSAKTDIDASDEEESYVLALEDVPQELKLLTENLTVLKRTLTLLDFRKFPPGIFNFKEVRNNCSDLVRNVSSLADRYEDKRLRHRWQTSYPHIFGRIQMMARQANELCASLSSSTTLKGKESSFLDLYTNVLLPIKVEIELIPDDMAERKHHLHDQRRRLNHFDNYVQESKVNLATANVRKFDLNHPTKRASQSTHQDEGVTKKLENFAFGKHNGFIALLDGAIDWTSPVISHFARTSMEKYSRARIFYVNLSDDQFGSVRSIGDLDRVFGQIATEMLKMPDLLDILAQADRGSGLVEAVLRVANIKAKAPWIVMINNLTIPVGRFLRHTPVEGDRLLLPELPVQGVVIIISPEQLQLPETLDVHRISQQPVPRPAGPKSRFPNIARKEDNSIAPQDSAETRLPFRFPPSGHFKESKNSFPVDTVQEPPEGGQPGQRSSSRSGQNDNDQAMRDQKSAGGILPLTEENLRRVDDSAQRRSTRSTRAQHSECCSSHEGIIMLIPPGAMIEYDFAKFRCSEGGRFAIKDGDDESDSDESNSRQITVNRDQDTAFELPVGTVVEYDGVKITCARGGDFIWTRNASNSGRGEIGSPRWNTNHDEDFATQVPVGAVVEYNDTTINCVRGGKVIFRRSGSGSDHGESSSRQRTASRDEDITIRAIHIPAGAVVEFGGTRIVCEKGAEITLGRSDDESDRRTDHGGQSRSPAPREERFDIQTPAVMVPNPPHLQPGEPRHSPPYRGGPPYGYF